MYPVSPQAYDRAITVFSPDGRLLQAEYAREAVKRGTTAVGIVSADGIVLAAFKNVDSPLIVSESLEKIFVVDAHVAITASGLVADARSLVDQARVKAQTHRVTYAEAATVESLAKNLGDQMQRYTQYGGVRPYGVALLIGGVDDAPHLFEIEPSGALTEYKAGAVGSGKKKAEEYFEKQYKPNMKMDDSVDLALRALELAEGKLDENLVNICVILKNKKEYNIFSQADVKKAITKAKG